jgi:hypothetical protein
MGLLRNLWACVWHPTRGFAKVAQGDPGMAESLGRMMALRVPVALLAYAIAVLQFTRSYAELKNLDGALWRFVLPILTQVSPDLEVQEIRALLSQLPAIPPLQTMLAWGLLIAPVGILGIWMHDAAWDHGCLWLLGGLKSGKGFRATLIAESEALSVGVFGAAPALLGQLPWVGWVLSPPLAVVGIWFWVLRGFSLAAFHGTPVWKGVVATLLHVLIAGCCLVGLLGLLAAMILVPVG